VTIMLLWIIIQQWSGGRPLLSSTLIKINYLLSQLHIQYILFIYVTLKVIQTLDFNHIIYTFLI